MKRIDGRNFPYYWMTLAYRTGVLEPGTDLHAIAENAVSVTPMQLDLTAHAFGRSLESAMLGIHPAGPDA